MRTKVYLVFTALAILSFTSCTKNNPADQAGINLADDDAVSEAVFEDIFNSVDNAELVLDDYLKGVDVKSAAVSDTCPRVIINRPYDGLWPKTITMDFGDGCTGLHGNTRAGKIITVISGPRREAGTKKTVTFENYFFNGTRVEGIKEIENLGKNESGNVLFSVKLMNGKLAFPDGKVIERSFEHQREWLAGFLTRTIWDDECLITGTAQGVNIKGLAYTRTIMTALHWKKVCRFMVSGVVKIEREGLDPVEINYGNGECDALATVTTGGETREITLKFKRR